MLVVGGGDDQTRDRVRKIILYALVGLIIIALASGLVNIIIDTFDAQA